MYCVVGSVLAVIGIVDALPKSLSQASDRLLQQRQAIACATAAADGFVHECEPIYSVDSAGQTVVEATAGTITLPTGSVELVTATFGNGEVTTITPSDILVQSSDNSGNTVFSNAYSAVTIPSNLTTTLETLLPNGQATTVVPESDATSADVQTSVIDSQTVILQEQGALTLSTGITTPLEITLPDSESTTITFSATGAVSSEAITTSANLQTSTSDSITIIFGEQGTLTLPTGVTTPIATTLPDGEETIITVLTTSGPSATTSDTPDSFIFPVTTSVPEPKATEGGIVIPCNLWFFSICIQWDEFPVLGWRIDLPPGTYPPGPPPAITVDPKWSVEIDIEGNLPDWPTLTIGPDNLPTYEPEPDECETETAEICVTSTSYDVSASGNTGVTTGSSVLSTCDTVQGCNLQDKESNTATTSTATCSATAGCGSCPKWEVLNYDATQYIDLTEAELAVPVARAVPPIPAQTQSMTTLVKREKAQSDATPPSTTSPPPLALYKRATVDSRSTIKFGACFLRSAMTLGEYLEPQDFTNSYSAASSYFLVSKSSNVEETSTDVNGVEHTTTTCAAGYIYSTSDYSQASRNADEPPYSYSLPRGAASRGAFNADHVYEVQLFGQFFAHALSLHDAPDCSRFNDLFVDTGYLQQIFDNGANTDHPDFAAMDVFVNRKKGNFFNPGDSIPRAVLPPQGAPNYNGQAKKACENAAENLQNYGIVAQFMQCDDTIALFRATHERVYQKFQEIDYNIGCSNRGQAGASMTWASTYSQWMTSWLSSRNGVFTDYASTWYSVVSNQPSPPNWPYTQLTAAFPVSAFTVLVDAMASGLKAWTPSGIEKRQDACTLDPSDSNADSQSTSAEPATILTDLPTLTTGISTPPGSSCVSTFDQTACALGSGGKSACVTTPACASWTATDSPSTTSAQPPATSIPTLTVSIYNKGDCTDLIDEFEIDADAKCPTHIKGGNKAKKFKCFLIKGLSEDSSDQQLELTVYKKGFCQGDQKIYPDLNAILNKNKARSRWDL